MTLLHWGIIGPGQIATEFVKEFAQTTGEIYGVASRTLAKALDFAEAHEIPQAYGSYAALFKDPEVDIVYIATPHPFHFEQAKAALLAGKHVLCEKPIAMTADELIELRAIATKQKLILLEAMKIYHLPLYPLLMEKSQRANFGKLKNMQITWGTRATSQTPSRLMDQTLAGGALLDIGVYGLSLATLMMSQRPSVVASQMERTQTGVDGESMILLRSSAQEKATLTISLLATMQKTAVLNYEKATVTLPNFSRGGVAEIIYQDGHSETLHAGDDNRAMNFEISDMQAAIRGTKNVTTMALTQHTMNLMTKLRQDWHLSYPFENPADF